MQRVISLTSIPPRFDGIRPVLAALCAQGAEKVILWLPRRYKRFPGQVNAPEVPLGVTLRWVDTDFGPATKLLPSLRAYPDARITVCDDDVLYAPGWLDALQTSDPKTATTGAGWSVTRLKRRGTEEPFCDIAQGFSGVSVQAEMFDDAVFNIPPRARFVDDIWLSGHLAQRSVRIRASPKARALCTPLNSPAPLQDDPETGTSRAAANAACAALLNARYGIWPMSDTI